MEKKIDLFYNEDHTAVAVLVSHGWGAGWSTWNSKELAYDARVVEFWKKHKDDRVWMTTVTQAERANTPESLAHKDAREFFQSLGYDYCPYMGGFAQIQLEWVPIGKEWRLDERDGFEKLVFPDTYNYEVFNA